MKVSIIVPVFNTAAGLLDAAARSVLVDPSGMLTQLIFVDDASTDPDTRHALAEHARADRRVTLLRNPTNQGPATSRNHGLRVATADWVGFLDADDVWLPGQLARLATLQAAQPGARWLATGHRLTPTDGPGLRAPLLPSAGATRIGPDLWRHEGPTLTQKLLGNSWFHLGATLTERRLCEEVGGFADGLYYAEDMHFFARLSTRAPLVYSECEGYDWRRHDTGLMGSPSRLRAGALRMNEVAARDPLLRGFRRQVRWAHYGALKGLASNNLRAGRRLRAIGFALRAWAMDPREYRALALFLSLCVAGDAAAQGGLESYSGAERFTARPSP